jgi:apolipoprotein N-acyltransferase
MRVRAQNLGRSRRKVTREAGDRRVTQPFFIARAGAVWAISPRLNDFTSLEGNRARLAFAVVAGLLLAAAFPKFGVAGFAWVAPGAILAVAIGLDGRQAFRLGFIAGLAHYLASLYWLLNIPVMKLAPIAAWLALSGFLALHAGAWVWLCWRMSPVRCGATGNVTAGEALEQLVAAGWARRLTWALACAASWVTWEMVQARVFSGFPWNFLGVSQYRMLPVIQIALFTGVYGVSFLAAWFGVSLLCAVAVVLRRSQSPRQWMGEVIVPLLVVMGVVAFGFRQVVQAVPPPAQLKVALVQPSIPQQWIWSPTDSSNRFAQLLLLSERALEEKPDLLVWPEAAVPGYVRWDTNIHQAVTNLVRRHGVWLVLGSDDAAPRQNSDNPFATDVFNASFLVSPEGELVATYRKRRLVIFGEYLPLARWLPFLERWTGMGSFTPGPGPMPFRVPELKFKTSVLICFEDVFPHHAREYVEDDTDFLLNLTNNGWFGESAAQWQHGANAIFRSVENRVPMVRCANNGLTCWVDVRGRLHEVYFPGTKDAYGAGFKIVEVPLLAGSRREPTFYRKHGDVFGWSCVAWSALAVGAIVLRKRAGKGG